MAYVALQLWLDDAWTDAADVWIADERAGVASASKLEYDVAYIDRAPLGATGLPALSCRYPVSYELVTGSAWPAFLLDMIPSGAARRFWEQELGLPNNPTSDLPVLLAGGTNPIGNLRVKPAHEDAPRSHPGFSRADVLERRDEFIEYARKSGASIAGSSGAGGDSPKLLLREDHEKRFHADGALPDAQTKACWLVKFPRTREKIDRVILEAEAAYAKVASKMSARTTPELAYWEKDCLFVRRFDRHVHGRRIDRHGVESLASFAGVAEFGARIHKEVLATALAKYATDKESELRELVLRDVLDVALGNTDNHARNTSVVKSGVIQLSPLYDFCPMFLDPRGVARVCRWADNGDFPDWARVADFVATLGLDLRATERWLRELGDRVSELPQIMKSCEVPALVTKRCQDRIERVARGLGAVRP